jgi:hypothetical protein
MVTKNHLRGSDATRTEHERKLEVGSYASVLLYDVRDAESRWLGGLKSLSVVCTPLFLDAHVNITLYRLH